jgi:hypothetical protein
MTLCEIFKRSTKGHGLAAGRGQAPGRFILARKGGSRAILTDTSNDLVPDIFVAVGASGCGV